MRVETKRFTMDSQTSVSLMSRLEMFEMLLICGQRALGLAPPPPGLRQSPVIHKDGAILAEKVCKARVSVEKALESFV
jgi:hypothetical protein